MCVYRGVGVCIGGGCVKRCQVTLHWVSYRDPSGWRWTEKIGRPSRHTHSGLSNFMQSARVSWGWC